MPPAMHEYAILELGAVMYPPRTVKVLCVLGLFADDYIPWKEYRASKHSLTGVLCVRYQNGWIPL